MPWQNKKNTGKKDSKRKKNHMFYSCEASKKWRMHLHCISIVNKQQISAEFQMECFSRKSAIVGRKNEHTFHMYTACVVKQNKNHMQRSLPSTEIEKKYKESKELITFNRNILVFMCVRGIFNILLNDFFHI